MKKLKVIEFWVGFALFAFPNILFLNYLGTLEQRLLFTVSLGASVLFGISLAKKLMDD